MSFARVVNTIIPYYDLLAQEECVAPCLLMEHTRQKLSEDKMTTTDFDEGLKIRREVMGDFYVDRALNSATDFNMDLQDLVTRYCWKDVWGRPGLDRKTRSLLNIAMLTALNRAHELEAHVMGAVNNGCTTDEIKETLLQATVYCGFPAGIDGFLTAKGILEKNGVLQAPEEKS